MPKKRKTKTQTAVAPAATQPGNDQKPAEVFPIAGIGASAGGLEAFTELLKHLPVNSGMGYVLIQHLDPNHESILPDLLARITAMPVLEAKNNTIVKPDRIYVIPSD